MDEPNAIYLDYAASTPCDERVIAAMLPYFGEEFGNAGNAFHRYGLSARLAVDQARRQAADLIGCLPQEVIWTSGATEANNLAIRGIGSAAVADRGGGKSHMVTAGHEHKSVLASFRVAEDDGWDITFLSPPPSGLVAAAQVENALRGDTAFVSIMAANNEIGTMNEIAAIGSLCRARGIPFHCDATQLVGKHPLDVHAACIDLLSWSAHKMYGPKGVGALFICSDRKWRIKPQLTGGGQEEGMRAGTLNIPGITGFGLACEIARDEMEREAARVWTLRDRLERALVTTIDGATVNGSEVERVANISSITMPLEANHDLVTELNGVACSSGSACLDPSEGPSHVLRAIGLSGKQARNTLRLSLGRWTTAAEIDRAAERIVDTVYRLM
ncbi:MAG: cysteine desulfurase family protein [Solirubrobacterales bacterium]